MKRNGKILLAPPEWVEIVEAEIKKAPWSISAPVITRVSLPYSALPPNIERLVTKTNKRRKSFDVAVVAYPGDHIPYSFGLHRAQATYQPGRSMPRSLIGKVPNFRPPGHTISVARQAVDTDIEGAVRHEIVHLIQRLIAEKTQDRGLQSRKMPSVLISGSEAVRPVEFEAYLVTFDSRLETALRGWYRYHVYRAIDADGFHNRDALRERRRWVQWGIKQALEGIPIDPQQYPKEYEAFRRKAVSNAARVFDRIEAEFQVEELLKKTANLPKNQSEFVAWMNRPRGNPYKAVIPIVSGIAYVRNGGKDVPWYNDHINPRPRRDAPTPGNRVFPLADRIWLEEEVIEVFVHGLPRGVPDDQRFRKVRVLMLHDPDRQMTEDSRFSVHPRSNDRPMQFRGSFDAGLPEEAMKRWKVIAAPPKLYHATDKARAAYIARHGITPGGDYGKGRYVWAAQTPNRAVRAFRDAHPVPVDEVEVYEIDMTGIPTVLREHGYERVALLEAIADFFDAPHVREAATRAAAEASGLGFHEDSRIIEGSVPLSRIKKLPKGKANPADLAGRHIPEKYLAGLPPALQKQRIRELTASRDAYKSGDFSELPTDRAARKMGLVKESAYTSVAKKRGIEWRGDAGDMAARILQFYGASPSQRDVAEFAEALKKVFAKGLAAWKSGGHRPGATAQNWAVARVNSVAVGGKAAWTADKKQFAVMPESVRKKIVAKLPEVYKALASQGRQKDVASIKGKAKANPVTKLEYRNKIALELAVDLGRPLRAYAKKMLDKYGSRAAGSELLEDAVSSARDAIIAHFVERYDDAFIEMYESAGDLYELRPIALEIGKDAIRKNIRGAMSVTERPDLQFWDRVRTAQRFLTEPGGPPPSDEAVANYLGLTLDEFNRKKYEKQILSLVSYDRYLQLGVEPGAKFKVEPLQISEDRLSPALLEMMEEGLEEPGEAESELMRLSSETFLSPDEMLYRKQLNRPEGYEGLLENEIVKAAIERLSPSDRDLVDTYRTGDTTLGMSDRQFERAIQGGYDPATRTRVPGLVDRLRPLLVDTAEKVMSLPEDVRDQIAIGNIRAMDAVQQAQAAAVQKQIAQRQLKGLPGPASASASATSAAAPNKVPRLRAFRNRR